jgi:cytochrome bd-type quinol oxidase subunit 2
MLNKKWKKRICQIFISIIIALSFATPTVLAAGSLGDAVSNLGKSGKEAGTTEAEVETVVGTAINAALTLVGLIFLVLMVYAGYLWMTARGEEGQVEKAQKIISAAVIGLVLVMSAAAITKLITSRFESAQGGQTMQTLV